MSDSVKKRTGWKILAIVLVVLIAAIIALPFFIDINQFKPQLESRLSTALGRDIKVGKLSLSILSGSVGVEDISIADNPAFSRAPFVSAKSLKTSVELRPLIFSKSLRISGIKLERPSITLIRSSDGKWNFSNLGGGSTQPTAQSSKPGSGSGTDIVVRKLEIEGGQITVVREGERRKPSVYNDVNITSSDLSYTTSFPFKVTASMPGGGKMKLDGKAGPLNKHDMLMTPVEADLAVEKFNLVASGFSEPESGLAGVFDFNGTVNSDGKQVRSKGQATADKLQIVKSGSPAGRQVSLQYTVDYDLAQQNGQLSEATITSGKAVAHLTGIFEARGNELVLKLALHGMNMPVQDLSSLLPAFGVTLPKGASLQGGYIDTNLAAEGPIGKMLITGTAEVLKTRLTGYDLSGKLAAIATLAGIRSGQDTDIEKFASALRMAQDGINVSNLVLIVPALGELGGNGRIAPDQSLDFTMNATLKPGGALGAGLSRLTSGGSLDVPFFVRGTASDPKFVPDAKKAAGGLLGSVLGGKKEGRQDSGKALGDTLRNLFNKKK